MPGSKPGERRGGRQAGTLNKATIERQNAEAANLAEARALAAQDIDPEEFAKLRGIDVMRMAMISHLRAGNLDKAGYWAERVTPYETPKLSSETLNVRADDSQRSEEDIRRELDELDQRAATSTSSGAMAPGVPPEPAGILH